MQIKQTTHVACTLAIAVDAATVFFAGRSPWTYVGTSTEKDVVTVRIVVDHRSPPAAGSSVDRPGDGGNISTFAGLLTMRPVDCGVELTLRGACVVDRPYSGERILASVLEGMTTLVIGALLADIADAVRVATPVERDAGNVVSLDRRRGGRAARAYARPSFPSP